MMDIDTALDFIFLSLSHLTGIGIITLGLYLCIAKCNNPIM
jgi:hypothetical protein